MPEKILTVVVPSYNVERYLADSLASYCAGGVDKRLEVLVIDDGSTDLTTYIARQFEKNYPGLFRLISKENGGHGSAINEGIRNANGMYLRVIDGDDRICTVNIPALLDELACAETDLVVDCRRDMFIDTGKSNLYDLPADLPRGRSVPFESVCTRFDIEQFFTIHAISVRTDFLREQAVSLLEHASYVDYEFIVKIASAASTIWFSDLEVCNYYLGDANQSVAPENYVRRWADHTRVVEELLRFARATPLDNIRQTFVDERIRLLVNTHYNIALIYDSDRSRGFKRAREFHGFLHECYPDMAVRTDWRYRQALILHWLGVDAQRLDRLMRRFR